MRETEGKFMRKKTLLALALIAPASPAAWGQAAPKGSVAAGREVAEKICAPCHLIGGAQAQKPSAQTAAPPFEQIARGPKGDERTLRGFLASTQSNVSHPGAMPGPGLTEQQTRDVSAYVLSLRDRAAPQ